MERLMKQLGSIALLLTLVLSGGVSAGAAQCSGGLSTTESNHTVFEHACYEFYFNNSGAALTSGTVVVWDTTGTGVNQPSGVPTSASRSAMADVDASDGDVTNIGTYITTTTTADDELVVGVTDDDSCANQSYCRVQTYGPRLVRCMDGTDAVGTGTVVGTGTSAGQCGDAANDADGVLGTALENGDNPGVGDDTPLWIFIRPGNPDG